MQIRKALTPEKKEVAKKEPDVEKEEENEDDKLLNELEELTNAVDRKKKQAKKLLAKRRAKVRLCFFCYIPICHFCWYKVDNRVVANCIIYNQLLYH